MLESKQIFTKFVIKFHINCFVLGDFKMTTQEKKEFIIKILDTQSSVTVSQLSEAFKISDVSVRKLLAAMEQEGLVKRTWGGAISAYGSLNEFSHKEKEWKYTAEKLSIAYAAYDCISDGDAVFLDCGTTTTQLARVIRSGSKRKILVGTNAINIAMELSEAEDISVIVIGGNFRHRILSCVGAYAEEMMKTLFFDKGFISGNHLTLEHGFTTPDLQEARMKRLMMASCKEHYIALDYSKFGDDSLGLIASVSDLDGIVTDWRTPAPFIDQLRDRGVKVVQGNEVLNTREGMLV